MQLKRDTREAYVPRQNLFRDREGEEPEEMRDRKFHKLLSHERIHI